MHPKIIMRLQPPLPAPCLSLPSPDTPKPPPPQDGPLHLQHTGYATNAAINAAMLAAWGTGCRLLVLESPGDTLVLAPGQQLVNATSPGGCLSAPSGQMHLTWCVDGIMCLLSILASKAQ
jgi:hypothetical protein